MRRIRSRLTILLYLLVIASSLMTLLMGFLVRNGIILQRNTLRYLLFGFAAKDIVLLLLAAAAIALAVTFTSRSTTNPIRELSRATREIAAGNFDVRVSIKKDRVEEYGELQRNFNRMAAQLKSNEYLRKDFISNVSHELKTPLSIMNGYAQLLACIPDYQPFRAALHEQSQSVSAPEPFELQGVGKPVAFGVQLGVCKLAILAHDSGPVRKAVGVPKQKIAEINHLQPPKNNSNCGGQAMLQIPMRFQRK